MNALIDGDAIETREALHDALAEQLALPDWYGRTLDALFDCLGDVCEDSVLRVVHALALEEHLGGYAQALRRTLSDASSENGHLTLHWED